MGDHSLSCHCYSDMTVEMCPSKHKSGRASICILIQCLRRCTAYCLHLVDVVQQPMVPRYTSFGKIRRLKNMVIGSPEGCIVFLQFCCMHFEYGFIFVLPLSNVLDIGAVGTGRASRHVEMLMVVYHATQDPVYLFLEIVHVKKETF
jgi:hypothetical protein